MPLALYLIQLRVLVRAPFKFARGSLAYMYSKLIYPKGLLPTCSRYMYQEVSWEGGGRDLGGGAKTSLSAADGCVLYVTLLKLPEPSLLRYPIHFV